MKRTGIPSVIAGLIVMLATQPALHAAAAPDFQEVFELVRTNVTGLSDAELNRAAVAGLLDALGPRVSLVTNGAAGDAASTNVPVVSKANVFDNEIAYLRIGRIDDSVAKNVSET